ncbi:hypothetical protein Hanom_Chr01g00033661 [Helianthus anomalus]
MIFVLPQQQLQKSHQQRVLGLHHHPLVLLMWQQRLPLHRLELASGAAPLTFSSSLNYPGLLNTAHFTKC